MFRVALRADELQGARVPTSPKLPKGHCRLSVRREARRHPPYLSGQACRLWKMPEPEPVAPYNCRLCVRGFVDWPSFKAHREEEHRACVCKLLVGQRGRATVEEGTREYLERAHLEERAERRALAEFLECMWKLYPCVQEYVAAGSRARDEHMWALRSLRCPHVYPCLHAFVAAGWRARHEQAAAHYRRALLRRPLMVWQLYTPWSASAAASRYMLRLAALRNRVEGSARHEVGGEPPPDDVEQVH